MAEHDALKGLVPAEPVPPGHYGRPGEPGVSARIRQDLAVVGLSARRGAGAALAAAAREAFGIEPPGRPGVTGDAGLAFVGIGPNRWLAVSETRSDLFDTLRATLGTHAVLTEQSDASHVFDLSGPDIRAALAKGAAIDLHPSAFGPGDAATTAIAQIGATIWQTGTAPSYRIAVPRSYATAFVRFLVISAAEFGLKLESA